MKNNLISIVFSAAGLLFVTCAFYFGGFNFDQRGGLALLWFSFSTVATLAGAVFGGSVDRKRKAKIRRGR